MASLQQIAQLVNERRLAEAADATRKLTRKKKAGGVDWRAATNIAAQLGDSDTALLAAKNWLDENPDDPVRKVAVVNALGAVARHEEAARLARSMQGDRAAAADGCLFEGLYKARIGAREEALALYRKALSLNPEFTSVWEQIALLAGYEDLARDIDAMLALQSRTTSPERLIPLYYALGRAFDRAGDIDRAFAAVSDGAALRKRLRPFNLAPLLAYLERLRATFTPELIERLNCDSGGGESVFILTAPRSGSTLVEQILATAPGVAPSGEHTLLRVAALALGSMEPADMERALAFKPADWRKMAQAYLTGLRRRFGPGKLYTDKTIGNYYYGGLARVLFPQGKLIWCKRDPRDVVWSAFRSRVAGNEWAQDLDASAAFINAHNRICEHWSTLAGDDLLPLEYESLVTQKEETTSALFAHVGVERPATWETFHESASPVATASLAQVRQPLNAAAVGSWRRYEKFLAPVYDRYFA